VHSSSAGIRDCGRERRLKAAGVDFLGPCLLIVYLVARLRSSMDRVPDRQNSPHASRRPWAPHNIINESKGANRRRGESITLIQRCKKWSHP
jgi:hypothetical protein